MSHSVDDERTHSLANQMPCDWREWLGPELCRESLETLDHFLKTQPEDPPTFPPRPLIFHALDRTPVDQVRVVILGQDPYHNVGQAHGLSFSVPAGVPLPPSLKNIYRELEDDLQVPPSTNGDLTRWAEQGVLLLNTVLTVRAHEAHSHRKQGWEQLTDAMIGRLGQRESPVAFVLWGKPAQAKRSLIHPRHLVIESAHPSPLSARRGFFGSRPFSRINKWLEQQGLPAIDW